MLLVARIDSDALAFAGEDGRQATAIAARVMAEQPALASSTVVRGDIEVRSSGRLTLASDLFLGTATPALAAPSVTLRAAGDLFVTHSLTTGLLPTQAAAPGDTPVLPSAGGGGSLRLTAGADLAAALPTATATAANTTGSVRLGRVPASSFDPVPAVTVASSSGRIDIAAAQDIQLLSARTAVFSTGQVAGQGSALLGEIGFSFPGEALLDGRSPFRHDGGSLRLTAGRDITGQPAQTPYITDWWWRTETGAWYARHADLYRGGVASFGGGDIAVRAGRDIADLDAAAVNSGVATYTSAVTGERFAPQVYAGGSVGVDAGRDLRGGLVSASGSGLLVRSGRAIAPSALAGGYDGLHVDYQNTAVRIEAAADATIGSIKSAGRLEETAANREVAGTFVDGLSTRATLAVASWGASLRYLDLRLGGSQRQSSADSSREIPAVASFLAPSGSIDLGGAAGGLVQQPRLGRPAELLIGAAQDVRLVEVRVQSAAADAGIRIGSLSDANTAPLGYGADGGAAAADPRSLQPVRVAAAAGDVTLAGGLQTARPLRLSAGRDVRVPNPGGVLVVHAGTEAGDTALSLIQAGRDFSLDSGQQFPFGTVVLRGRGDLVVVAGRHVDLGRSGGLVTRGNLDDSLGLPAGGGNLTVLTGVNFTSRDYARAVERGVALLGNGGVASRAGELATWLESVAAGRAPAAPGSAAASAFDALSPADQLARAATLLGTEAFASTLQAALQTVTGLPASGTATALRERFNALPTTAERLRVVQEVLAAEFDTQAAGARQQLVLSLAAADIRAGQGQPAGGAARARLQALQEFVAARQPAAAPADPATAAAASSALAAFAGLPLEQQMLRINAVVFDSLRAAGRQAALAGAERELAYAPAYAALASIFPGLRGSGNLDMTSSQIKTQQGGHINLLAPGGNINAGALAASNSTSANTQGIVTVAGGDINAAASGNFAVNQSRVFTLARGNLLLWSSQGNLDAGRGAKTVRGAPAPIYGLDANGNVTVDTSGSFTGSGIAVLDAQSTLDLYAPRGEINAGEAGISSAGNAFLGANTIVGTDNLAIGGVAVGAPPAPPSGGVTAGLSLASQTALPATPAAGVSDEEEEKKRQRKRRNFLLDFLGFGQDD